MDYIVESILNYVKKENTNYAILLNGRWGSGKTFFWENVLRHRIEEIDGKNSRKKLNALYVSLYGVSSLDEINKKLVLDNLIRNNEAIQKFGESKWGGRLTEMAKLAIGTVKNLDIPVLSQALDTQLNYENLIDFTDTVLCFDDLERANIGITDIMGYINNLVEHDGVKTIIISNEAEITAKLISQNIELKMLVATQFYKKNKDIDKEQDKDKNEVEILEEKIFNLFDKTTEYKRIKEKLIGKTLTYMIDSNILIENILDQITNSDLMKFLKINSNTILQLFKDSGTDNIRVLKQALDDFEQIFINYKNGYSHLGEDLLLNILRFTLASSFEIKTGARGNEEFELLDSNEDYLLALSMSSFSEIKGNGFLVYFKRKYYNQGSQYTNTIFFKFVENLVRKGIFDQELFEKEMGLHIKVERDDTPPDILFLRDGFWYINDDDFPTILNETYNKLINGEVPFIYYFKGFESYRYLIQKKAFSKELKNLKQELLNGLNKAAENAKVPFDNMDTYFIGRTDWDDELILFKETIIKINQEVKNKNAISEIENLIENLNSNMNGFLDVMKEKYYFVPVLAYCNEERLFNNIINLDNKSIIYFSDLIRNRYKYQDEIKNNKLFLEYNVLNKIQSKLDSFLVGITKSPRIMLLEELSKILISEKEKLNKFLEEELPEEILPEKVKKEKI
ncbi:P-loop NTPase fold protein [Peribacillus frigoritolerans]|uniref:P-loop NTPase fold protein n=1 Tax=Peribacillus frigoritolerans TaxID=450367 RepID=UPI003814B14E